MVIPDKENTNSNAEYGLVGGPGNEEGLILCNMGMAGMCLNGQLLRRYFYSGW